MIAFLFSKVKVYLLTAAAVAALVAAGYYYYTNTQARLSAYAANQAVLELSVRQQQQTINALQSDINRMTDTIETLNTEFADSRQRVRELEDTFRQNSGGGERDFGEIAAERAALVERLVNNGTQEVLRCFELLSGATATSEEIASEKFNDCVVNTSTRRVQ
jgi:TolA-binding protein